MQPPEAFTEAFTEKSGGCKNTAPPWCATEGEEEEAEAEVTEAAAEPATAAAAVAVAVAAAAAAAALTPELTPAETEAVEDEEDELITTLPWGTTAAAAPSPGVTARGLLQACWGRRCCPISTFSTFWT